MTDGKLLDLNGKKLQYECPKCKAHDIETKRLMGELFGRHEQIALSMMLAQNISVVHQSLKRAAPNNHLRPANLANIDFMSQMLGKFFVSLDEKDLDAVKKFIKDRCGMEFNMQHESCPHKEQNEPQPTPSR